MRRSAHQTELWNCPNCGRLYVAEDTGERVKSRHHGGNRKIMVFRTDDTDQERTRCTCGRHLHWLYNGVNARHLRGGA